MRFKLPNRYFLSAAVIFFYLIPILFFAYYSLGLMARQKSWSILTLGLLMAACGALSLILLLYYWEQVLKQNFEQSQQEVSDKLLAFPIQVEPETKVTALPTASILDPPEQEVFQEPTLQTTLKKHEEEQAQLLEEINLKKQEISKLEELNQQLQDHAEKISQDFSDYKIFSEEQLKQKNLQIASFQQTIESQQIEIEKRQEQIQQLNVKVHDLSYEIKTLLHLHESDKKEIPTKRVEERRKPVDWTSESYSPASSRVSLLEKADEEALPHLDSQISTPHEAALLLKRCISIAQRLTGAHYYGVDASPHYAIDQRRLFDSLRSENSGIILVYSQLEHKLLFVNNQVKHLLGWSSEKFIHDFSTLIEEGLEDWKQALNRISETLESQTRLLIKSKQGQEILFNCHLKVIPNGLFKNYAIGVLYPA